MPATTIALGAVLIVLGLGGYVLTGAASLTALIPAAFGLLLALAGLLARDDRKRMHAIHAAVVIALLGFLGSVRGLLRDRRRLRRHLRPSRRDRRAERSWRC